MFSVLFHLFLISYILSRVRYIHDYQTKEMPGHLKSYLMHLTSATHTGEKLCRPKSILNDILISDNGYIVITGIVQVEKCGSLY